MDENALTRAEPLQGGRFRKKPVVIEAWQLPRDVNERAVLAAPAWVRTLKFFRTGGGDNNEPFRTVAVMDTLEGTMRAEPLDWIIRGVKGELYPCKPDIFALTYEPASTVESLPAAVPVWFAFKHNLGNGKFSWTFHNPEEAKGAYRDTCLEIIPLYSTPPAPAAQAQAQALTDEQIAQVMRLVDEHAMAYHQHRALMMASLSGDRDRRIEESRKRLEKAAAALRAAISAARVGVQAGSPAAAPPAKKP